MLMIYISILNKTTWHFFVGYQISEMIVANKTYMRFFPCPDSSPCAEDETIDSRDNRCFICDMKSRKLNIIFIMSISIRTSVSKRSREE